MTLQELKNSILAKEGILSLIEEVDVMVGENYFQKRLGFLLQISEERTTPIYALCHVAIINGIETANIDPAFDNEYSSALKYKFSEDARALLLSKQTSGEIVTYNNVVTNSEITAVYALISKIVDGNYSTLGCIITKNAASQLVYNEVPADVIPKE